MKLWNVPSFNLAHSVSVIQRTDEPVKGDQWSHVNYDITLKCMVTQFVRHVYAVKWKGKKCTEKWSKTTNDDFCRLDNSCSAVVSKKQEHHLMQNPIAKLTRRLVSVVCNLREGVTKAKSERLSEFVLVWERDAVIGTELEQSKHRRSWKCVSTDRISGER